MSNANHKADIAASLYRLEAGTYVSLADGDTTRLPEASYLLM